jgi:serine/threonine protein kinase
MAYANGGSLDSFINQRRGGPPIDSEADEGAGEATSAKRRKEKHRLRHLGAVHLLRLDEILQLFEDIVNGLAFLHARNILHLDMKVSSVMALRLTKLTLPHAVQAENVLLHWEEDDLLPTAKLSDFGNATSDAWTRERSELFRRTLLTARLAHPFHSASRRFGNPGLHGTRVMGARCKDGSPAHAGSSDRSVGAG